MQIGLGERVLTLDRSRIMGILNVTPDSFSDGGQFLDVDDAIRHASQMLEQGADIIDVGGESTRPGAARISVQEELDRTIPVIERICENLDVAVSIDTCKADVMRAAVASGAVLINDIFAFRQEGALAAAADLDVTVCLMHMQGEPQTMQDHPEYEALPGDIIHFLEQRVKSCMDVGIGADRIVIDPGFGFGKNTRHNLQILANLDQFSDLNLPILVGLSRKRTLGMLAGHQADQLEFAGAAAAVLAVVRGANIVRTHDVASTADALRIADAVRQVDREND